MGLIKIKSFCIIKEAINKKERQLMQWEKIFANPLSDKWLLSKIYKEHIKFKVKTKQFDYKMGRGSE